MSRLINVIIMSTWVADEEPNEYDSNAEGDVGAL